MKSLLVLATASLGLFVLSAAAPPTGVVSTIAGSGAAGASGDGGPALSAALNRPDGLAFDNDGNLVIADTSNHRIRRINAAGDITTIAGTGAAGNTGDGGSALTARLNAPSSVVVDKAGNIFVSDSNNNSVRKITPSGIISTFAGTGTSGFSGDSGPASSARLNFPLGLAFDANGNLFIADYSNNRVRRVASDGTISTAVGNGTGAFAGDGGLATNASLWWPCALTFDSSGNLYIAVLNNRRIRRVGTNGIITTLAGSDSGTSTGNGGLAVNASIGWPYGIAVDPSGNVFFSDTLHSTIRVISTDGNIYPVAGNDTDGFSGDGGPATSAAFNTIRDILFDKSGNLIVADKLNNRIRKVTFPGTGGTPGGTPGCTYSFSSASQSFSTDGGVSAVGINAAAGCAWTAVSNASWVTLTSVASGAGNGSVNFRADPNTGAARSTTISVAGLSFNVIQAGTGASGNLPFILTTGGVLNGASFQDGLASGTWITIRGSNLSATTRTWRGDDFAGNALPVSLDGVQVKVNNVSAYVYFISPAQLNVLAPADAAIGPVSVQVVNSLGSSNAVTVTKRAAAPALFVYSQQNGRYAIAQDAVTFALMAPAGLLGATVTTKPAIPGQILSLFATGLGATNPDHPVGQIVPGPATITSPFLVLIGGRPATVQFAGLVGSGLYQVNVTVPDLPTGDAAVVLYVNGISSPSQVMLPIQGQGSPTPPPATGGYTISTFAGTGSQGYSGDGGPAAQARLDEPFALVFDASGNLYIADINKHVVRKVTPAGVISTFAGNGGFGTSGDGGPATQAQVLGPNGLAIDSSGNIYISQSSSRIRKVTADGRISTFAGTGVLGYTGDGGPAVSARISGGGLAVDAANNVYLSDTSNHVVRKITPDGVITTFAGTGVEGYSGDGGPATRAQLRLPTGVAVDPDGNVIVATSIHSVIRKIDRNGTISTIAGVRIAGVAGDGGPAANAQLVFPQGLAFDAEGNLFISDTNASTIRRIDRNGIITKIAGTGAAGTTGDGGSALNATLRSPIGIAIDSQGRVFIAQPFSGTVRMLTPR